MAQQDAGRLHGAVLTRPVGEADPEGPVVWWSGSQSQGLARNLSRGVRRDQRSISLFWSSAMFLAGRACPWSSVRRQRGDSATLSNCSSNPRRQGGPAITVSEIVARAPWAETVNNFPTDVDSLRVRRGITGSRGALKLGPRLPKGSTPSERRRTIEASEPGALLLRVPNARSAEVETAQRGPISSA